MLLKGEHLQRTGSFKIRGAYHRIARLDPAERAAGVVAASAGNHAQGVALAASLLGVRSTIFMPATAPFPKVAATRGYGAEVVLGGVVFDDALAGALAHAERTGAMFVSPFDDPLVIAGQGTVGLELAEQAPEAGIVVVSVGGGGLISGVAVALKALRPGIRVIGVEAEGAASMTASLAAGRTVTLDRIDTMADGIAVKRVSDLTLAHVSALVDDIVTVSEEDLSRALLLLLERTKAVVEPAGAAPLAAALAGELPDGSGAPVCLILSGGNIDPTLLIRVIRHGLTVRRAVPAAARRPRRSAGGAAPPHRGPGRTRPQRRRHRAPSQRRPSGRRRGRGPHDDRDQRSRRSCRGAGGAPRRRLPGGSPLAEAP